MTRSILPTRPVASLRFAAALALAVASPSAPARAESAAAEIFRRFAADYAADPSLTKPVEFGLELRGNDGSASGVERWRVSARPATPSAPAAVEVASGFPERPGWYFTLDLATLEKLDRGEWNALTAMGKARESDVAPMDVGVMDGFQPDPGFVPDLLSVSFHFWTRGLPERIPFGAAQTRTLHGAQASILYYQPGFRSAWVQIRPGQHANANPNDQTNPFPTLFVGLTGRAKARIGGVEIELDRGEALFIPAGTAHEFWNPYDEPAEGILLMFGDGA